MSSTAVRVLAPLVVVKSWSHFANSALVVNERRPSAKPGVSYRTEGSGNRAATAAEYGAPAAAESTAPGINGVDVTGDVTTSARCAGAVPSGGGTGRVACVRTGCVAADGPEAGQGGSGVLVHAASSEAIAMTPTRQVGPSKELAAQCGTCVRQEASGWIMRVGWPSRALAALLGMLPVSADFNVCILVGGQGLPVCHVGRKHHPGRCMGIKKAARRPLFIAGVQRPYPPPPPRGPLPPPPPPPLRPPPKPPPLPPRKPPPPRRPPAMLSTLVRMGSG